LRNRHFLYAPRRIPEVTTIFLKKPIINNQESLSTTDTDTGNKGRRKKMYDALPENYRTVTLSSRFDRYLFLISSVKNVPVECALMRFA